MNPADRKNQPLFQHVQQVADDLHREAEHLANLLSGQRTVSQEDIADQIFKEDLVQAGLFESLGTLREEPVGVLEIVLVDGCAQYLVGSSCHRFYFDW